MDEHQRDLRRALARAFLDSLDDSTNAERTPASQPPKPNTPHPPPPPPPPPPLPKQQKRKPSQFSFAELEEAIADIDEYLQSKNKNSSESDRQH